MKTCRKYMRIMDYLYDRWDREREKEKRVWKCLRGSLKRAEREGFEPSVPVYPVRRFSKPLVSATHPPLRKDC